MKKGSGFSQLFVRSWSSLPCRCRRSRSPSPGRPAGPAAGWYSIAGGIATIIKEADPDIVIKVVPGGGLQNPAVVASKGAEIGWGLPFLNAAAYKGMAPFEKPLDELRALAGGMSMNYFHFYVDAESPLNTMDEIFGQKKKAAPGHLPGRQLRHLGPGARARFLQDEHPGSGKGRLHLPARQLRLPGQPVQGQERGRRLHLPGHSRRRRDRGLGRPHAQADRFLGERPQAPRTVRHHQGQDPGRAPTRKRPTPRMSSPLLRAASSPSTRT